MKYLLAITVTLIALTYTFAAPYDYPKQTASTEQKSGELTPKATNIKITRSNSVEQSTNPLDNNKYDFVRADCQDIGSDVQVINNKEYKINKIGCVYPGDKQIPADILQAVNDHFRTRVAEWAKQ